MNLTPVLIQRFFSSTGAPLAGGQLFSYQAGTTTPQNTYTDSTGSTPNSNPVILDANGQASIWLDPTLSYKFVLEDANSVVQWTVDNVVGVLTAGAVNTAAIQTGAVTSACLAAGAVNAAALESDASIDANRPVNTNNIRNGAITRPKVDPTTVWLPPTVQGFFSVASGTYNLSYQFIVTSANAASGATYTNNGQTFTVRATIAAQTVLQTTGTGAPAASGTLTKATGTGDATITFSSVYTPLYIRVTVVGGGGGGAGNGGSGQPGSNGSASTFGSSFLTAGGGIGGLGGSGISGGAGGAPTVNGGIQLKAVSGGSGGGSENILYGVWGGQGGCNPMGGGGGGGGGGSGAGQAAAANTGGGGGGQGGSGSGAGNANGVGGGAGAYIEVLITSPAATYAYSVGGGGAGYSSGTAGGNGGSGMILVEEHYQ